MHLRPSDSSWKHFIRAPPGVNSPKADTAAAGVTRGVEAREFDHMTASFRSLDQAASKASEFKCVSPWPGVGPCRYLST